MTYTLASSFTLATAVNETTLVLLVLLRLSLRAFRRARKGLQIASPLCFAEPSLLPGSQWCQHVVISLIGFFAICAPVSIALPHNQGGFHRNKDDENSHQNMRHCNRRRHFWLPNMYASLLLLLIVVCVVS